MPGNQSQETRPTPEFQQKRVRQGAKSCVECRIRKIRCIWPFEGASTCRACLSRGSVCQIQRFARPATTSKSTPTRGRIKRLESDVINLRQSLQQLEQKLQQIDETDTILSKQQESMDSKGEGPSASSKDSISGESEANLTSSNEVPSHLFQLFDNDTLEVQNPVAQQRQDTPRPRLVSVLQSLLPSKEDMIVISIHASSWLQIYNRIFPLETISKTGEDLLLEWEQVQNNPNMDPVAVLGLLLTVAITVQQAPKAVEGRSTHNFSDPLALTHKVSGLFEQLLISDDPILRSVGGIEAASLFLRLQLGVKMPRKLWLYMRWTVALAELLGLPKASKILGLEASRSTATSRSDQSNDDLLKKANIWESICILDRMVSLMWSFTPSTIHYPIPNMALITQDGNVDNRAYICYMMRIADRIFDLDDIVLSGASSEELSAAAMSIDHELHTLYDMTKNHWSQSREPEFSSEHILKYIHQYYIIRAHLRLALTSSESQEYPFSFSACVKASKKLATLYVPLRRMLPTGFFINRVFDLQVLTACVFLELVCYRRRRITAESFSANEEDIIRNIVDEAVSSMKLAAGQASGDFAKSFIKTLMTLRSLLDHSQAPSVQRATICLAFVGNIHVSRKPSSNDSSTRSAEPVGPPPLSAEQTNDLSFWMELPDKGQYSCLLDDDDFNSDWLHFTTMLK